MKKSLLSLMALLLPLCGVCKDFSPYVSLKGATLSAKYEYTQLISHDFKDKDFLLLPAAGISWKGLRAEVEYSKNTWKDDGQNITYQGQYLLTVNKMHVEAESFMFNAYYDFLVEDTNQIYLYVGAGAGLSKLKAQVGIDSIGYSGSENKNALSWALYAGFSARVETPPLPMFLDIGYKYVKTKAFESDNFITQGFTFGFRYMF